jgi:proline dehydrogenase
MELIARQPNLLDPHIAFINKTDQELSHSEFIFKMISNPWLVKSAAGLTKAALLLNIPVNTLIKKTIYSQFCGGEDLQECLPVLEKLEKSNIKSILDYSIEGQEAEEDFEATKKEIIQIIQFAKESNSVPYTSLKVTGIASHHILKKVSSTKKLTPYEQCEWQQVINRMDQIISAAKENDVQVFVDAEESWLQNAIDFLTEAFMKKYNKLNAVVFTTLQMYRWDRLDHLQDLVMDAKKYGYVLGVKLVRGAYWEKEIEYADENHRVPLVHMEKEDTDNDFNSALELCIQNIDCIELCSGSHNEQSTLHLINLMEKYQIDPQHPHIMFSQLYGMSDNISYNLASMGYNVSKYLPYGPVKAVLPYLIRRAEENTAISGQMSRELSLIKSEILFRKQNKQLQ